MKFSCTQENLNRGLQLVGHIANKNSNLPILQNVLLRAEDGHITLAATNLEIGITTTVRGKIEASGEFTLPAQLFSNYVNLVTAERIDCELQDKEFRVVADGQETVIKGEEAAEFPILPAIEKQVEYAINKHALEVALQQTVIAASVDETRPEIAGVLFSIENSQLILAATDSYRLAETKVELQKPGETMSLILPQRSTQELLRILQAQSTETVTLYASETQLACEIGDVQFVSRVIEGSFPAYQQIIPENGLTTVVLPIKGFVKAIKGAALFSKTGINDIELVVSAETNTIEIRAINAQLGENTTIIAGDVKGEDVKIVFNYRFVLDGLQNMVGDQVVFMFSTGVNPGVCRSSESEEYTYVIMPIKQ